MMVSLPARRALILGPSCFLDRRLFILYDNSWVIILYNLNRRGEHQ